MAGIRGSFLFRDGAALGAQTLGPPLGGRKLTGPWGQAAFVAGAQSRTPFDGVAARYWRVLVVGAKQAGQPAAIARIALRIARDAPLLVRQRSLQVDEDEL